MKKNLIIFLGRRLYLLTNTKKYTIGRTPQCDLCLADDVSVSRDHAVIHRSSSGIRVEDQGSKYGTFVNNGIDTNKAIDQKVHIDLQAGNIVRFGRLENVFRLENIEFKVCTSTLTQSESEKLKKQLKIIGGEIQSVWSTECTHLVMANVTVTVKVLQSLAYGVPIVSPDYFDRVIESAEQNRLELPSVKNFIPDIVEPYVIKEPGMMDVHLDRQRLFQNKTFVFMVKRHMERFEPILKLAAGKCINMEEDKVRKSALLKVEYIPVQYAASANTQCSADVGSIVRYIESNNRRLINDSEIGLAIIHRATDRFCNPDRKMLTDFEPAGVNTDEILKTVLQDETPQDSNTDKPVASSVVISESINLSTEPNNNVRNDEIIDLDKPSTSGTRRSTRSSLKTASDDTKSTANEVSTPKKNAKLATSKKNPKRKADEPENFEENPNQDQSVPLKKQRTANESQGESSSAHFIEPMPPSSENDLNFSGFISTQNRHNRKQKGAAESASQFSQPPKVAETVAATRKRALNMLNADSDDDNDDNEDGVFNFKRKSKRAKVTQNQSQRRAHGSNTLNDSDDDDEDGELFNFSRKPSQTQSKPSKLESTRKNYEVDGPSAVVSQNSYKKPFQHSLNRSFHRFGGPSIDITSDIACLDDTDWITCRIKNELNFSEQPQSSSSSSGAVKIKTEKMEESEMTDEQKKRQWIKSFAKAFQVRKIQVNQSRRSAADETDGIFSNSGNTTLNKTTNFKKFIKVSNLISFDLECLSSFWFLIYFKISIVYSLSPTETQLHPTYNSHQNHTSTSHYFSICSDLISILFRALYWFYLLIIRNIDIYILY